MHLEPERGPETDFRWRGRDVTRLEAVSDAVFALALTLVMLADGVPSKLSQLRAVFEQILPLGISFTIVGMIWHAHYLFFRRYGLRDGWSAFLNGVLMFLVLLFAYPMKLLFGMLCEVLFGFGSRVPIREIFDAEFPLLIVYSLGFAAIYLVIALLYRHAWAQRDRLALDEFECAITRQYHQSSWILAGFGLLSATLAAVLPDRLQGIAGWLYFGIGPAMGVHAWRCGVRRARLRAARSDSAVA